MGKATAGPIRIFSTDTDSGTVTIVERDGVAFRHVATVGVGNAPRGAVKFTADGRGFVSNCGGDTISEIDAFTGRETGRIRVGPAPRGIGILPGDRYALVSSSGENFVSIVDLGQRAEIGRVAVGRDPRHMAVRKDGTAAYVAVWGAHYVAHIDTAGLVGEREKPDLSSVREIARIEIGDEAHPYSLTLAPDGDTAYVANTQATYVSVIDLKEDWVADRIELGSKGARAVAFSPDGDTAYVAIEDTSEVVAIDTASREIRTRWPVGPGPRGIALDPTGVSLFASVFARQEARPAAGRTFQPNTLTVIDLASAAKGRAPGYEEIPVGKGPCSVAVLSLDTLGRAKLRRG